MDKHLFLDEIGQKSSINGNKDLKLKRKVATRFEESDIKGEVAPRHNNTSRPLKLKHPPPPADLALPYQP